MVTPTIVDGDLLDQQVDVIVNAWNRNIIPWWLLIPQGISGAIKRRAGLQPFFELGRMGAIPLGEAVMTGAGRLPYQAIHPRGRHQHVVARFRAIDPGLGGFRHGAGEPATFEVGGLPHHRGRHRGLW